MRMAIAEEQHGELSTTTRAFRFCSTMAIMYFGFSKGASFSIQGPTMMDIKDRLHTKYEFLSDAMLWKNGMSIFGALLGGQLTDRFRLKLNWHLAIYALLLTIATFALSIVRSPYAAAVSYAILGLFDQTSSVASFIYLLSLWGPKSATVINAGMAMQTFGGLAATIFMRIYFSNNVPIIPFNISSSNNRTGLNLDTGDDSVCCLSSSELQYNITNQATKSLIYLPYAILSIMFAVNCIFFLIMALIPTTEKVKDLLQNARSRMTSCSCKGGCQVDRSSVLMLFCGLLQFINGASFSSFVVYIFTVAVEVNIGFTKQTAASLTLAVFAVIAFGRSVSAMLTAYISIIWMTLSLSLSLLISEIVLVFFGTSSHLSLWICVIFNAAIIGSLSSNILAFEDKYISFNGGMISIFSILYNLGQVFQYWLNGYLLEHTRAWYNLLVGFVLSLMLFGVVYGIFIIDKLFQKPTSSPEEDILMDDYD